MESLKFTITTKMEKEDLKKFMYIVIFFRKKSTIPMLVTVSLLGSLWVNYAWGNITTPGFFIVTMIMLIFIVGVICFKIERRVNQRIKTDNTGTLGSQAYMVRKKDIKADESVAFKEFMQSVFGAKYKRLNV